MWEQEDMRPNKTNFVTIVDGDEEKEKNEYEERRETGRRNNMCREGVKKEHD